MNINFIGKEFERLACLEDCINYEYEPKTNLKYGKRNIYFDDIKLDFINEVNTYGFSPFLLESFVEQRDDPNIMKFITKKFNHGLTNYIKVQNKGLIFHSNKNKKKILSHKSTNNIKNYTNKKNTPKKENLISNIFLIKKNEDIKKNEEKEFFLQKAFGGMCGHKLNISTEEEKDKEKFKIKEKKNIENNKNKKDSKDIHNKDSMEEKNNIELLKKIFIGSEKKTKNSNNKLPNLNLIPGVNNFSYSNFNQGNLKSFLDKLNKLPIDNQKYNYNLDNKILTLSKNRNILGNKILFSPSPKKNFKNLEAIATIRKERKMNRNYSMNLKKFSKKNKFGIKTKNKNKDIFLLFAKARPYRYMGNKDNYISKKEENSNNHE